MLTVILLTLLILISLAGLILTLTKKPLSPAGAEGFERTLAVYQQELKAKESKIDALQKNLTDAQQKKAAAEARLEEAEKKGKKIEIFTNGSEAPQLQKYPIHQLSTVHQIHLGSQAIGIVIWN